MENRFEVVRQFPGEQAEQGVLGSEQGESDKRYPKVELTVCGSPESTLEQNQEEYGRHIANEIIKRINETRESGKTLILDLATGSSPKPVWIELRNMVREGSVDLSHVVFMGHEEGWGNIEPGSIVDFDGDRRSVCESLGVTIDPIISADQVTGETITGNFIQMHLDADPRVAVARIKEIMSALRNRTDIEFLGLYGVGTDGHVDEMQTDSMGIRGTLPRRQAYLDLDPGVLPPEGPMPYSAERGLFRWRRPDSAQGDPDEFEESNNFFWYRGKGETELYGRPADQDPNFGTVDQIIGLGWRDMLRQEKIILMFNDSRKQLAFQLALEGAFNADIVDEGGATVVEVEYDRGVGEKIYTELKEYASTLIPDEVISQDQLDKFEKCDDIFRAIYLGLDKLEASSRDAKYIPVFEQLWRFINRYVGRRAPVSRLIRIRNMLGLETELVTVPEVLSGTKYGELVTNSSPK